MHSRPLLRPRSRPAFPRALAAVLAASLALLFCLLFPSVAHAQIVVQQKDSPLRVDASGNEVRKRDANFKPEGISYQDCLDNQGIKITLTMPPPEANASLQVWGSLSGADCKEQTARTGGVAVCWRILSGVPLSINPTFFLPVRKIIGGRNNVKDTTKDPDEGLDGPGVCGTVDLTTITVQFLYFPPGNAATASQKAELNVVADTIGPVAPTGLKILPGNSRLAVSFDSLGEGGVVELSTIRAYCDPDPGKGATTTPSTTKRVCEGGASDAALDPDADADAAAAVVDPDAGCVDVVVGGTTTPGVACSSVAFSGTDGGQVLPDNAFNDKYECGSLPVSTTGSAIKAETLRGAPLQNGKTYAVALAASDSFLNVGPLSAVVCEYPEPTHDFWDDYKSSGGQGGGGFCSIEGAGVPIGSFTLMGMALVLGVSVWRRSDRGRRNGR